MSKWIVIGLALLAPSTACASPTYDNWVDCLKTWSQRLNSPSDSANVIVDGAMGMCGAEQSAERIDNQNRAMELGLSRYDLGVERMFQEHVANTRRMMIGYVLSLRAAH